MTFSYSRLACGLVAIFAAHAAAADQSTYLLSYLGDDPATAYGPAENLTVFAPGMLPGGQAGPVGPVWITVTGSDGSITTIQMYSTSPPSAGPLEGAYTVGRLTDSISDPTKVAQITALLTNGQFAVHDAASAAALQAAIWEVEYEAGTAAYNVATGSFQITGYGGFLNHAVIDDAAQYLMNVETGTWVADPEMEVWQFENLLGNGPSFSFLARDLQSTEELSIPEPAALAVMAGAMVLFLMWIRDRVR